MTTDSNNKNIALIGMMGTGKSTAGKLLAKELGFLFVDLDKLIEEDENIKITEIFERFGEEHFRDLESRQISALSNLHRQVISTGGGIVERPQNLEVLKKMFTVCLSAKPETIIKRLGTDDTRPLLNCENPLQKLNELLKKRKKGYEAADFTVETDNKTPEVVMLEVKKLYEDSLR